MVWWDLDFLYFLPIFQIILSNSTEGIDIPSLLSLSLSSSITYSVLALSSISISLSLGIINSLSIKFDNDASYVNIPKSLKVLGTT